MKPPTLWIRPVAFFSAASLLLAACRAAGDEATPTLNAEQIQTQAVATFAVGMTATALAIPTDTPTETVTPTPTATNTLEIRSTAAATVAATIPVPTCDGSAFVSDVSVPDNTVMTPGQKFTKTWRVRNSGTCPWQTSFKLRFTSGEAMGGSSVSLANTVQPGSTVDISVALTAPDKAGTSRGNWRMTNAAGTFFGDEVYVLIVVGSSTATSTPKASATSTLASTAEPTQTPTPTPTLDSAPTPTSTETETSG